MSEVGYCLYGFYKKGEKPLQLFCGLDGSCLLETISFNDSSDLACIVSKVPLEEFGEDKLQENLQDIKWLEKNIRAYDEITCKLFEQTTFIPVRFGTIYLTEERILKSLENYSDQVRQLIETLGGKLELGVKFFIDSKILHDKLLTSDEEGRELNTKIQSETPGKGHFLKKKLDALLENKIQAWVNEVSKELFESLKSLSNNIHLLGCQPSETSKKMFFNAACLLPSSSVDWFKGMIKDILSREKLSSIECEITGPWPPYSFVNLQNQKLEKEFLDV